LVVQTNKPPSPTRPLRRQRPSPRPDPSRPPRLFDRRFPRVALAGSPSRLDGTDAATATSQIRPGIPRRDADRGRSGRPDRLKAYKSSWQTFWQTAASGPPLGKAGPAGPAWPAGLWWSPPPESNRRPHPYHSCGPPPIEEWAQVNVTRVTVSDRQRPPVPAACGTQMARPAPRGYPVEASTRSAFSVRWRAGRDRWRHRKVVLGPRWDTPRASNSVSAVQSRS
jgi:hypothetical protein